ncbi:MAG: SemiSWEET transporter [Beijerinckiaceae bacterium]|nr:SemiSWEET transporter [Beijerinckiaceae bacterium]
MLTVIGGLAAICSTASFAPQAWKIIKTRDTSSISVGMYVLTVAGFTLWFCYGLAKGEWPLVASNGVCLALSAFILLLKCLPQEKKDAVSDAIQSKVDDMT